MVDYRQRAEAAGLDWTEVETLDAVNLDRRLFPATMASKSPRSQPDWSKIHLELHARA